MNRAPFLDLALRSFSPAGSTDVTSLRSITHVQTLRLRYAFFQFVLSSLTHGSTKRPCKTQRISAGVLVMLILSTCPSFFRFRLTRHSGLNFARHEAFLEVSDKLGSQTQWIAWAPHGLEELQRLCQSSTFPRNTELIDL